MKLHVLAAALVLTTTAVTASRPGDDEADSVYQWGRWSVLAPAAGLPQGVQAPGQLRVRGVRVGEAEQLTPKVQPLSQATSGDEDSSPDLPLAPQSLGCTAGAPCGLASRAAGRTGGTAAGTVLNAFLLEQDGTAGTAAFRLNSGAADEAASVSMAARLIAASRLRAGGSDGAANSTLFSSDLTLAGDGSIARAVGFWGHDDGTGGIESGRFAWGIATGQADLDALNAGNVSAAFSGAMAGDPTTRVDITVDFGAAASWSGSWSGGHSFGASGSLSGPNLVADSFSNVDSGRVEGVLLGPAADQAVAVGVDVQISGQGQYTDVGLIPQVVSGGAL
ncbi:hypothetical protein QVG61_03460 [Thiohalobacter sp. IOR34]|uniref:hypothetical protein n=1 Tax=Thiohalobacter sp. IOR34 TaxID=3057176 RepID=UPI0025B0E1AB|nr:hypothetical protein [Thiohalobacter sp. IOR34]WJW76162.1 hypothetical protein QVG61_03460 [Thiohalobacter sp. IOR34]